MANPWGPVIRKARLARGMGRTKLARKVGIGMFRLRLIETHHNPPKPDHLQRIMSVLGIPYGAIPQPINEPLAPYINRIMREKGYTYRALARITGLSIQTIGSTCRGDTVPYLRNIYSLAHVLGVSPAEFIRRNPKFYKTMYPNG